MRTLLHDLRFGLRMLAKNPGFTIVAVLSLALGIGASTAVFSLVNAILLRSLPVLDPHELRVVEWSGGGAKFRFTGMMREEAPGRFAGDSMPYPIFENLREQCAEQAEVFGYAELHMITVRAQQEPFTADGLMVSDNFFSGLGIKPIMGGLFGSRETSVDDAHYVVITYPWWEKHFGFDTDILGQNITLNSHSFTVAGVLPPGFPGIHPGDDREFYVSMDAQPQLLPNWPMTNSDRWWVRLMARKKPRVSDTQCQASFDVAFSNAAEGQLEEPHVRILDGKAGPSFLRDYYKKPLLLTLGVVCVFILVACANLAGLSLVRGAARHHEFAIRAAIGANRWRLTRQMLTESLLLSLLGGIMGILFALWGRDAISMLMAGTPDGLHYDVSLDFKVLGFTLAVTLFTAILSGLLPASRAALVYPLAGLKVRSVLGMGRVRTGRFLVIAQVALSSLLLICAGLYVRTLINLVNINPGFDIENLLLLQVNPGSAGYETEETVAYFDQTKDSLAAIPGVRSAALTRHALLSGSISGGVFLLDYPSTNGPERQARRLTVSESFFKTLDIPLLVGREFTFDDVDGAPKVVIVNETFVHINLPNINPVGRILRADDADWQIVGVCADIKFKDIKGEVPPTVYFTFRQDKIKEGFLVMRTSLPAMAIADTARRVMAAIDPAVPIVKVITQKQIRDEKIAQEWMFAVLSGSLTLFAVLLACIGLYGLMAYTVTQRTSEIGIRKALGATHCSIMWPILREALTMSMTGVLIGGLASLAVTRLIRSQLYGVTPHDPITIAFALFALFVVAVLACYIPARRAAKVDPMVALRYE